ncbi:GC-rich sequence DNA-binding factor-like protein-domain-containing protein [Multifurca ochricompacta]|uniref:GC-rich sequence DNA-binding factor-like protein-domain-containing protein n=1 Tax=Multifurca ochricompacta TaxID=376703 RepID=A0AAD4MBG1_9AGAM|nr:GC-rich sequence DNA-binding factor-like protein-domain-containing protein [Multifurca ochricompacta]
MARRKRGFMEDGISDSSGGSDDENADDDEPYQRKKRRTTGDEDSEDEGFGGRRQPAQRRDWAKAPAFVSSKTADHKPRVDLTEVMDIPEVVASRDAALESSGDSDEEEGDQEDAGGEGAEGTDSVGDGGDKEEEDTGPSKAPSPRVRDEADVEEEQRPRFGGLGLGASKTHPPTTFSVSIPPTPSPVPSPAPEDTAIPNSLPSAFGGGSRPQRAFVRNGGPSAPPPSQPKISAAEGAHFRNLEGSFGARMLAKMGWQSGTGLGAGGQGIVTPIESKLRPKNMGIAFKGFVERTEQSKAERVVAERLSVMMRAKNGRKRQQRAKRKQIRDQMPGKNRRRLRQGDAAGPSGLGVIIDATGATPREVSSLAEVSIASWTPSTDSTRIPEVRHNVRLIAEAAARDLEGLAREAKEIQKRRKALQDEEARLTKKVSEEAELISRMKQVHLVVDDIQTVARQQASEYEASLEPFSPQFHKLLSQFPLEFDRYRLDEVVVAAIAPIVRRTLSRWNPLEDPGHLLSTFRLWKQALKLADHEERPPDTQVGMYGVSAFPVPAPKADAPMTPFESLLWNVWLPRVRSCINNDWDPRMPQPAVQLYEAWSTFLPPFIRDNFLDQLILPKVSRAVADWSPRRSDVPLKTLVFPWLPHVGLRMEEFLGDARRKMKSLLRGWDITEGLPNDLAAWREVFSVGDWDTMMLKYIVPKLGATLRDEFRVNPRSQDMSPLDRVLAWGPLLRGSIFASLLAAEFFPKWLDVLHVWLVQPRPNFDEVAQWYAFWKSVFSEDILASPAVRDGFTCGLQLMNTAIELGSDAPTKLPRPEHHRNLPHAPGPATALKAGPTKKQPARVQEITFRSIVEEFLAKHNLIFLPAGRVHERSRMPLFRVSPTADGKGGILVYILDDAVWAPDEDGDYRAITLENMALRAMKSST